MAGYAASRTFDFEHLDGAAGTAIPSTLNLLLLALMNDITGDQT